MSPRSRPPGRQPRRERLDRLLGGFERVADPDRDAEVRAWRLAQVERCIAAADTLPHDVVILDGELPPARLAAEVLEVLGCDTRFALSGCVAGG